MNDEILLIDKPDGMTSFGVVARVRRVLSQKQSSASSAGALLTHCTLSTPRSAAPALSHLTTSEKARKSRVKVGHTGTLDPFATGLLILLTGKGTKRANEFLKLDKKYEATVRLGATSTTGDPEGEITERAVKNAPSREQVEVAVQSFVGEITQRVPNFSAVKINGQRAYKLAREGKEVKMPTRQVQIYGIEIIDYTWPELKITCRVSSGTYIRTLGEDIGATLGVGGYLTSLRRTEVGGYKVENAVKLADFMSE